MKKIHFPLATLVVVLVAYGVGLRAHAQTTTTQTNDGAESRTFHQRYITAFNKMDVATIMSYLPGAGMPPTGSSTRLGCPTWPSHPS